MKTGSASYGIDFEPTDPAEKSRFRWGRFPLLPICDYREGDAWNTSGFSISWLNIRAWTMDSVAFFVAFHIEDIGCFLHFQFLYLNIYFWLLPFPQSWHQRLWRKPKSQNDN